MAKRYKWTRVGTRLIYKIRHHKGHGIHSPFVFNLVNNVIEEKRAYYCYADISDYLSTYHQKELTPNKRHRLAFRLVNYFGAQNILEIGSGMGINTLFLTASSSSCKCLCVEKDRNNREVAKQLYMDFECQTTFMEEPPVLPIETKYDCIFINLDYYSDLAEDYLDALCKQCHNESFIVVTGIRRNKVNNQLWKHLSSNQLRTVELDLFNIGIIFFDKQLSRWEYKISF